MGRTIDLAADGAILFFGSMNSMPMAYALDLKRRGQDVVYFVDVPAGVTLSRPECHYPEVTYPYEDWVVEAPTRSMLPGILPRLVLKRLLAKARRRRPIGKIKAVFLSGFFIALAPYFPRDTVRVFLSYGSDFEAWSDPEHIDDLARGLEGRSVFRVLPSRIAKWLLGSVVRRNFDAARQCDALMYFPRGVVPTAGPLIDKLEAAGVRHVPRYDIDFSHLGAVEPFRETGDKLIVISPVRFLYKTFSEGHDDYSKGNDILIRGLAKFYRSHPNLEVHFFEKGIDLADAKRLCAETGLASAVVWHPEMPFQELLALIRGADIYCDQVGKHIIGTGMYAMFLGKPVITNMAKLPFWADGPIRHAATADEVSAQLDALADVDTRRRVAADSRRFALERFSSAGTMDRLLHP